MADEIARLAAIATTKCIGEFDWSCMRYASSGEILKSKWSAGKCGIHSTARPCFSSSVNRRRRVRSFKTCMVRGNRCFPCPGLGYGTRKSRPASPFRSAATKSQPLLSGGASLQEIPIRSHTGCMPLALPSPARSIMSGDPILAPHQHACWIDESRIN